MTRSQVLFKAIDYLFHVPQNYKRFPNVSIDRDIVYDENYSYIAKGDAYFDKRYAQKGKYPVILNIHGGGFVAGDKKHRRSISSYFADKGWFVFNINYRLSPYYAFPSPNIDCMKALNYLKQMEEKYNLDLDKVVVTGDSAGAYFAAYLVAASNNQKLRNTLEIPDPEVKIAGFMGFCGPYDIALSLESKLPFGLTRDIAGCFLGFEIKSDFSNLKEFPYYDQLSPINFVDKNWRPSFIAYAEKDIFCKGQGEYLKQQLEKLNIPVFSHNSMKLMDNHCYHLDMFKAISKDCLIEAVKFLDFIKGLK